MKRDSSPNWSLLGATATEKLAEARTQAHFAAQFISAFGAAYVTRRDDMSHMGLAWSRGQSAFVSGVALGPRRVRMALNLPRFEIYAMEPVGNQGILERLNLKDVTLEASAKWMRKTAARFGFDPEIMKFDFSVPPDHPLKLGEGFTFDGGEEGMEELGRYFDNADHLISHVCSGLEGCSQVLIWPGNLAISAVYSHTAPSGKKAAIGMGLVPGGDFMNEPYFFASLFPAPGKKLMGGPPQLGKWIQAEWTGLALGASEFLPLRGPEEQKELAERFLTSSIALLQSL